MGVKEIVFHVCLWWLYIQKTDLTAFVPKSVKRLEDAIFFLV